MKIVFESDDESNPVQDTRKNIRKMIRSSDLRVETKEAVQRELERRERLEEKQKLVRIKNHPNYLI